VEQQVSVFFAQVEKQISFCLKEDSYFGSAKQIQLHHDWSGFCFYFVKSFSFAF